MRTLEQVRAEMSELRARLNARPDGVPNLRDYGLSDEDRSRYERDITAYHAETASIRDDMQALGYEAARSRNSSGKYKLTLRKDVTAQNLAMAADEGEEGYPADHVIGPRGSMVTLTNVENSWLEVCDFANDPYAAGFVHVRDVY